MNERSVDDHLSLSVLGLLQITIHLFLCKEVDHVPHGTNICFKLFNRILRQLIKNSIGIGIIFLPKHFEFLRPKVAVEEIETVVINGEVAVLVDLGLIDLLLLLLEDDLARNIKILKIHVVPVETVQFIFPSLTFKVVGVGKQFGDLVEEGVEERRVRGSSHEVVFERGEYDHKLVHWVHTVERLYILLHFLEAVIGHIEAHDLRFDASVSSVHVLISDDILDPLEVLSECVITNRHNASVLL